MLSAQICAVTAIITACSAQIVLPTFELPKVQLPWGTYQASAYDDEGDFYTFQNVRFGRAPVDEYRFQRSAFPAAVPDPAVVQPNEGSSCYQVTPPSCPKAVDERDLDSLDDDVQNQPRQLPAIPKKPAGGPSEDCLFADLYVPSSALRGVSLPIVVWIYGGGFIFGAKDAGAGDNIPFYNGTGILRAAHKKKQDFIFMTGNYRMGAFGWLAGPTVEDFGAPNAGLWDQRLMLEFAQRYGPKFGGNPNEIGVWGESAGAGSILHHLTASEPPVFKRAMLQSPAYLWQWDRSQEGYTSRIFQNLTAKAGCPTNGSAAMECLRKLSTADLQKWNSEVIIEEHTNTGLIAFNPAVDGKLIKQLPTSALQNGQFWPNISSFIVSHVFDESKSFVPCYVKDDNTFEEFLNDFFPGPKYAQHRAAIDQRYDNVKDAWKRAHEVIKGSSLLCNTRYVFDAYNTMSNMYMMQYNFFSSQGGAVHAADLLPTFFNTDMPEHDFYVWFNNTIRPSKEGMVKFLLARIEALAEEYQPYLASFGATGVPKPKKNGKEWSPARPGNELKDVMEVQWGAVSDFDEDSTDMENTDNACGFWRNMSSWVEFAARS